MLRERRRHAHFKLNGRLDRKSSRGMIFENEELRLRTININAEVERGQTDIKRLRRENEQLRREIWTLRDECDRLNKRFKAKILDQEHGGCNARGSGGSSSCNRCPSPSNSDDSDSCDTCKGDDGHCSDECCQMSTVKQNDTMDCTKPNNNINVTYPKFNEPQNLHNTFDHLSVVSEETLSNSEVQLAAQQQTEKQNQQYQQDTGGLIYPLSVNGSQTTLPNLMGQLTPVELVANQLNDLQTVVPPLSYFENILQDHMGSTMGTSPDTASISPNSKIVKHTNGWDYNLQSPFAQRNPSNTSSTSSPSSASIRSPTVKQRSMPTQVTLSTFIPNPSTQTMATVTANVDKSINNTDSSSTPKIHTDASLLCAPKIETVAITTMPTTAPPPPPSSLGSPKHFFSPLKPRLKINTCLANKNAIIPTPPIVPTSATETSKIVTTTTTTTTKEHQNCDPPDIYVANALASPYKRPPLPSQSPQLSQRCTYSSSTPNVSPRHCQHHHYRHQHQHQHQTEHFVKQQQQKDIEAFQSISPVFVVDVTDSDFDVDTDTDADTDDKVADDNNDAAPIKIEATSASIQIETASASATDKTATKNETLLLSTTFLDSLLPIEQGIVCFAKEPIYAIAQERSCNLISASALSKPLMAATINSPSKISIATIKSTNSTVSAFNFNIRNQTESVNLESILNDIENISEDILAIQLEKNKSRENLDLTKPAQNTKPLNEEDKNKKPYRSEMNLFLSYDGKNPTITQAATKTASSHSTSSDNGLRTRARSLERDTTDSPSPKIPDAMPAFPYNRTYMGLEQPNKGVTSIALQLQQPQSHSIGGGESKSATSSPKKAFPPTPPIRMYPSPLNARYANMTKSSPVVNGTPTTPQITNDGPAFPGQGLLPNKSHLYKALANAAAKRAQFRLTSPTLSRSLDTELNTPKDEKSSNIVGAASNETSPSIDAAARKARRVSIVCGESPQTPDQSPTVATTPIEAPHLFASTPMNQLSTGSCINLTATPTNPVLQSLKQFTCHSTPSSPHSLRRHTDATAHDELIRTSQIHLQRQRSNISNTASQHRRSSQDSMRGNTLDGMTASINPTAFRSKCSRRYSDGTVASNTQRISGSSGHHHHHHHHHQHSSSTVGTTHQHHNRHSQQDNNLETGSVSDRNSNSLSSSRDSSTSFSMRSQRRKISVSSHTGGKIPWCGCWGNGCL